MGGRNRLADSRGCSPEREEPAEVRPNIRILNNPG